MVAILDNMLPVAVLTRTGTLHYVDNSGYSASEYQGDGTRFHATLAAAISACSSYRGDVIVILPSHAETISAVGGITVNKIGVRIIGMGSKTTQPTFTFSTAAAASLAITAADVTLENLRFTANFADGTENPWTVGGDHHQLDRYDDP